MGERREALPRTLTRSEMASFAITEAATAAPAGSRRGAPRWLIAYMYILPATLIMAAITYWPILFQVYMSFTDYGLRNLRFDAPAPNFVGLQNFIDLVTNGITVIPNFSFWGMLSFNLFWTFSNVIFHVTIGILIAVILNTPGLRFRGFYRAIFILPIVVPTLVVATVWRNLFDLIYMVSGGGPLRQTEILVTTAFRLVNEQRLYGLAAAFGIYTMIILLVLTLLTNRITKATESYV